MNTSIRKSNWLRGFLAILFFQMGLALPLHAQASIQEVLVTVGKLGPILNTYIKPLQLEWLAPLEQALTSCKFGSDIEVTQCADAILSSEAGKELGGADGAKIKLMLEIYLDVREGDIGELFNDVIKIAAGQSPLDLACSVISIVASGFPVCDVLKALYEIGKLAYAVGKAIVSALADIACEIYAFFGGDCGNAQKVGPAEFVAVGFANSYPTFPVSLQARVGSNKTWADHKKEVFNKTQSPHLAALNKAKLGAATTWDESEKIRLYGDANLEAAWSFYTTNTVYPEWDKLVVSKLIPIRTKALSDAVNSVIDDGFRVKITDAAQKHLSSAVTGNALEFLGASLFDPLLKPVLEGCEKHDLLAAENLLAWVALKRGTDAARGLINGTNCRQAIAIRALPRPACSFTDYGAVQGSCTTQVSHRACQRIAAFVGASNLTCSVTPGSALAKELAATTNSNNNIATLTTLKAPCVDTACGTQITQMWQRCGDGKGPYEGSGEFAPQTNRDEACATSYSTIYKLAAGRSDVEAHLEAERTRALAVNCRDKAACTAFIAKEFDAKTSAFSKFRVDTLAKLIDTGVYRSSANALAKTTIDTIASFKQEKIVVSGVLAGTVVSGAAPLGLGGGTVAPVTAPPSVPPAKVPPPPPMPPMPPLPPQAPAISALAPPKPPVLLVPPVIKPPALIAPPLKAVVVAPVPPAVTSSTLKPPMPALGTALVPKPIDIDGCSKYLGRADEFLCNTDASFASCKLTVDSAKLKNCRRTGSVEVYQKR